jgi:hypothetical protein
MRLQPKNWSVFQHYKDRSPPWIKLHRDLLINRDFICLPIASKALAPLLWLLASESKDGIFDASFEELQFRLHISRKEYDEGIKPLIDKEFFAVASGVLAECKQLAIPETERETEKEEREKVRRGTRLDPNFLLPEEWCSFCVKTRPELSAFDVWEQFRDYWIAQPGQKGVKTDWDATWRNWVRRQSAPKIAPADIARITVPGSQERDPALVKLDLDRQKAKPPSLEVLAKMAALRKGT